MGSSLKFIFFDQVSNIGKSQWQALIDTDYPFVQYEFFRALEESKVTSYATGWQPQHLTIWSNNQLTGLVPLYLKRHSYGEYVFDFQWADAYHQSGRSYYPKLVTAIPFTPATGPRIFLKEGADEKSVLAKVCDSIRQFAKEEQASSWHLLFPEADISKTLQDYNMVTRLGIQYHWLNRSYDNFDTFLSHCRAKKRKNIRRERQAIESQRIQITTLEGEQITQEIWQRFYTFYQLTYAKRSGHGGYLNSDFFQLVGKTMKDSIVLVGAYESNELIAASLFFKDQKTLYGRYWGCVKEVEFLHFELCYYQGIEYCIRKKLNRFDAGAQGEHKIPRGFEPVLTYSNHWIDDPRFAEAIGSFVSQEAGIVKRIVQEASLSLPYKV